MKEYKSLMNRMILTTVAMVLAMTALLMGFFIDRSDNSMLDLTVRMINTDADQLRLNINNYFTTVQNTVSLMFADEAYYGYDATDESIDDYDRIQKEKVITNRIQDIALNENFSDFGVVYANDKALGWISQTTSAVFKDGGIYDEFASSITDENTQSGWSYGHRGNYERLYYVQRLNEHAVVVTSFYTSELEAVFDQTDELSEMTIRLLSDDDTILFSTDRDEVGTVLPADMQAMISGLGAASVTNADQIAAVQYCSNHWRLLCSIPTRTVLSSSYSLRRTVMLLVILVLSLFVIFYFIYYHRIFSRNVGSLVEDLSNKADIDQLSDVFNKMTMQTRSEERRQQIAADSYVSVIMLDLDDFKNINDTQGHMYGDQVIQRMGTILKHTFRKEDVYGRVGGDEFAAFADLATTDPKEAEERAKMLVARFFRLFDDEFEKDQEKCKVSASIGVKTAKASEYTFNQLYAAADEALYHSKQNGKGELC